MSLLDLPLDVLKLVVVECVFRVCPRALPTHKQCSHPRPSVRPYRSCDPPRHAGTPAGLPCAAAWVGWL
jgi:hypothetical protein